MAAAVFRSAARKICGRALDRPPQSCFTASASTAVNEAKRLLLPRISHGGSALRRFSSTETSNLLNKNKLGTNSAAKATESSGFTNNVESSTQLKNPASSAASSPEEDKFIPTLLKLTLGAVIITAAAVYVEAKYIFGGPIFGSQQPDEEDEED